MIKAGLKCSVMAQNTIEQKSKTNWEDKRCTCTSSQIIVTIETGQSCPFNFAK